MGDDRRDLQDSRDEALARVTEAIADARRAGDPVDVEALARAEGVDVTDVELCLAAVDALGGFRSRAPRQGPQEAPSRPPRLPPEYELLEEIGRGGMGAVYRARQRVPERIVAVKVLRPSGPLTQDGVERFQREARSLARLRHPNIVSVHEVGEHGGDIFFTMDWIDGESLAQAIARRRPLRSLADVLRQVAAAIAYAHSRGVVHRDLKPSNILIDASGRAYVVDFGLAHDRLASLELTRSGHVLGSPAYMSPEQARGDPSGVGPPVDIYALGASLYECLTGSPPFCSHSLAETLRAVAEEVPVLPRRRSLRVPRDLERICLKAMAKDPRKRYTSAGAFGDDLVRFLEGEAVAARGPGLVYRTRKALGRNWKGLAVGFAGALLILVAAGIFLLPKLGGTATNYLAQARELERGGEFAGAAALYGRALEETPRFLEHVPRDEAWRGLLDAKARVARALHEAGRTAAATETLEAVLSRLREQEPPVAVVVHVLWDLAAYRMALGRRAGAIETVDELRELLGSRTRRGTRGSDERVLDEAVRVLREERGPWRDVAAVLAFRTIAPRPWIRGWFARAGPVGCELLVRILTFASREELTSQCYRILLEGAASEELAQELARALAALLAGESSGEGEASEWTRVVLADALSLVGDLPYRLLGRELRGERSPGASPIAVLEFWREVSELGPLEGYRRRVAKAVELVFEGETSSARLRHLNHWLREHTGAGPTPGRGDADHGAFWRQWWAEHREDDPRRPLLGALGLELEPGDVTREAWNVLENTVRRDGGHQVWTYYLIASSLPADDGVPLVQSLLLQTPDSHAWDSLLRAVCGDQPHTFRAAGLDVPAGAPESRVAWERLLPVSPGGSVVIRDRLPLSEAAAFPRVSLTVPGVLGTELREATEAEETIDVEVAARLTWSSELGLAFLPSRFDVRSPSRWRTGYSGTGVALTGVPSLWRLGLESPHPGAAARAHLVVFTVVSPGEPPRSWTFADWRERVCAASEHLADLIPSGGDGWELSVFVGRYQQALRGLFAFASWFPLPEALDSLRRLEDGLRVEGRSYESHVALAPAARLLAGDASVLEGEAVPFTRPQSGPRYGEPWHSPDLEAAYLMRLATLTEDEVIRRFALAALAKCEIRDELALRLGKAARARGVELPSPLDARVAQARRGRVSAWVPRLALSAALLLGFVLSAALCLWPGRARRLVPAGLLVLLGTLVGAVDVTLSGWNLLPDVAGHGGAALGAFLLARRGKKSGGYLCGLAFLLCAILDGVGLVPSLASVSRAATEISLVLAVLSVPLLRRGLDRVPARARRDSGRAFRGAVWTTFLALTFTALVVPQVAARFLGQEPPPEVVSFEGLGELRGFLCALSAPIVLLLLASLTVSAWRSQGARDGAAGA